MDEPGSGHILGRHAGVLQPVGIGSALVPQGVEFRGNHDGRSHASDVGVSQVGLCRAGGVGRKVLLVEPCQVVPSQEVALTVLEDG